MLQAASNLPALSSAGSPLGLPSWARQLLPIMPPGPATSGSQAWNRAGNKDGGALHAMPTTVQVPGATSPLSTEEAAEAWG